MYFLGPPDECLCLYSMHPRPIPSPSTVHPGVPVVPLKTALKMPLETAHLPQYSSFSSP